MTAAVILVALGLVGPAVALAATSAPRPRTRVRAGMVAGLLVVAAGVVFALVARGSIATVDLAVLDWMLAHRTPGLTAAALALAVYGGTVVTGGLAVLGAVLLAWRRRWRPAIAWVLAVAVGATAIRVLKEIVERPRPPLATRLAEETSASLPSGHSLMAALGLGLAAATVPVLVRARPAGVVAFAVVAFAVAVVGAAAIGVSRAYLGVHWASDVLAGWLLGAALVAAAVGGAVIGSGRRSPPSERPVVEPDDGGARTSRPSAASTQPVGGTEGEDGVAGQDRQSTSPVRRDAP